MPHGDALPDSWIHRRTFRWKIGSQPCEAVAGSPIPRISARHVTAEPIATPAPTATFAGKPATAGDKGVLKLNRRPASQAARMGGRATTAAVAAFQGTPTE